MPDFLKNLISQIKEIFVKLTKVQKIVILGVAVVVVVAFIYLISAASDPGKVLLYTHGLKKDDYKRVRTKL
ncbi:MAG: hypothetical protein OEV44_04890, partial [Spirochaetota bacterium]|nr:hypothetical protein [Spirochaetota bacterium]